MTARKNPAEDSDIIAEHSDIIEGVAVEKKDKEKSRGKAAGGGARRRAGRTASATESPASPPDEDTGRGPVPDTAPSARMPLILAALAVILAGAGLGLQFWRAGLEDSALRAEIDGLASRLAAAEADGAAASAEAAALKAELSTLSASLPPDLSDEVAGLVARQDAVEAGLAAVESAGPAPVESGGDAILALAQSGMNVAAAMINDSLSGADPSRWLATLSELHSAGLVVGDLDALRAVMSPLPATHDALVVAAHGLIEPLRGEAVKHGHDGWWSAATGRLSDFVTLRRQGDGAASDGAGAANTPLLAFERAVAAGRLADALAASATLTTDLAALADWQAQARRRLALDDALAAFSADMAARLARAHAGKAG